MKKKFINGLLLVALFVGFTGSLVSCKDYDDEKIEDLVGKLSDTETSLRTALEAQKQALENEIKNLTDRLNECMSTCEDFRNSITKKLDEYLTIEAWTQGLNEFRTELGGIYYTQDYINKNYYTKDEVDNLFKSLSNYYTKEEIDNLLNGLRDEMKKYVEISSLEETIAGMISEGKDKLTDALETYFINNKVIEEYIKGLGLSSEDVNKIVEAALVSVNATIAEVKATSDEALALAQKNAGAIEELKSSISALETSLDDVSKKLQKEIDDLNASLSTLQGTVNELQGTVTNLSNSVISLGEQLDKVQDTANQAKATADANSKLIANLESNYSALSAKVDGLEGTVEALKSMLGETNEEIAALKEQVAADKAEADKLHREMLETISGLASGITEVQQNLGQLRSEFEAALAEIRGELKSLQGNIDAANANIAANKTAIEKLAGVFENALAKFITGIEINGAYNQLFGTFNLPFDLRSDILVSFHGTLDDYGIRFPTDNAAYYAIPEAEQYNLITEGDLKMLGINDFSEVKGYVKRDGNSTIISQDGAEGNAGTLYMTVNPTDRDFTGTEFELIDSRNNTSVVTLSNIRKSDHLIYFGYTRGGIEGTQSSNGFYEAKATYKAEDLNSSARLEFDLGRLKEVAEDLQGTDAVNLTNLSTVIYKNLKNILPATAVKATWKDDLGQKSVVSQYAIAATSVRPLAFSFAKDTVFTRVPGFAQAEDFIDGLVDKVFAAMPDLSQIWNTIDIESIELDELTSDMKATFHVYLKNRSIISSGPKSVTVLLPSYTLIGINGEEVVIEPVDPRITVTITDNDAEIIIQYNIQAELEYMGQYTTEPVENIKAQISDFLVDVNKFIDQITDFSYANIATDIKDVFGEYFDKINKRLWRFLTPNKLLHPTMLWKSNGRYGLMSHSGKVPSVVHNTSFLLAPTTYTGEVLSPAYKKFVAVTNVYMAGTSAQEGDAVCKNILDKANKQDRINEVIEGGFDSFIEFKAEKGCVYEFLYMAVDYAGKVFANKFYVIVRE